MSCIKLGIWQMIPNHSSRQLFFCFILQEIQVLTVGYQKNYCYIDHLWVCVSDCLLDFVRSKILVDLRLIVCLPILQTFHSYLFRKPKKKDICLSEAVIPSICHYSHSRFKKFRTMFVYNIFMNYCLYCDHRKHVNLYNYHSN